MFNYYYSNGILRKQVYYKNGKLSGPYREFDPSGRLKEYNEYHLDTLFHSIKIMENGDTSDTWYGAVICPDTISMANEVRLKLGFVQDQAFKDFWVSYYCIPIERQKKFDEGEIHFIPTTARVYDPTEGIILKNLDTGRHIFKTSLRMKPSIGEERVYLYTKEIFMK